MYKRRNEILDSESIHDTVLESVRNHIMDLVNSHIYPEGRLTDKDIEEITEFINENLLRNDIKENDIKDKEPEEIIDYLTDKVVGEYEKKIEDIPQEIKDEFEKVISLNVIDHHWTEQINTMSHLREGIYLRGYAQEDPLRAYTMEGFDLFDAMMQKIDKDITILLVKSEIRQNIERKEVSKTKNTNRTDDTAVKKPKKNKEKIGRNDLCPCGSGKKYKQCCGK